MAIVWKQYDITGSGNHKLLRTWTTHEGAVIGDTRSNVRRVMSDIYADTTEVLVWNAEKQVTETVELGSCFELCDTFGEATKDASAELLSMLAQRAELARITREEQAKSERAARELKEQQAKLNAPVIGKTMKVVGGRGVKHGTIGKVFWVRDGRVGLSLDDTKDKFGRCANVAWTKAAYLAVV